MENNMRTSLRTLCAALPALFIIGCATTDGGDAVPPAAASTNAPVCTAEAKEVLHEAEELAAHKGE